MPIIYVNPAGHHKGRSKKKRRSKRNKRSSPMARRSKKRKSSHASKRGRGGRFVSKKRRSKGRSKARRVRKLAKGLYRVNPAKKKGRKGGKRKSSSRGKRKSSKRKSSRARRISTKRLMKMARARGLFKKRKGGKRKTRKLSTRARVAAYMGGHKRPATYVVHNPSRRRRKRKNPSRRRGYRRNPARRAHRRYRRNPGLAGIMTLIKKAAPVVAGIVVGKIVTKQIQSRVAAVSKLGAFQGPALSAGMLFLANAVMNKVKPLAKYRDQVMLGLGINLITEVIAMTPLKGFLGLGEGIYDRALSDYVTTSDYLTTGATPIDDDIALSDYVTTGALEEELGLSEELGISEELGAIDAGTVPGGVSSLSMIKAIPHQGFMEQVPARSFTKDVPHAGEGYDNPGALYAGIFRGGF